VIIPEKALWHLRQSKAATRDVIPSGKSADTYLGMMLALDIVTRILRGVDTVEAAAYAVETCKAVVGEKSVVGAGQSPAPKEKNT
jgi:hypothetical protein